VGERNVEPLNNVGIASMKTKEELLKLGKATQFKKNDARSIKAARRGGKSPSIKKTQAALVNLQRTPNWLVSDKEYTTEQLHFTALIADGKFGALVKDLLLKIASDAKTSDDYHKVLMQVMKIPEIQKTLLALQEQRSTDITPIVIEVLRKHGREDIIKEIYDKLPMDSEAAQLF
jgi:hypothetical protein